MNRKNLLARKVNKDQELKKLAILSDRDLFLNLRTSLQGLSEEDAQSRLEEYGPNEVTAQKPTPALLLLLQAFNDPFVYVLALLAVVSLVTNDLEAAAVMTIMILASVLITFIQEYRSQKASIELKEMIENTAAITRNGETKEIPMDEVVPGDILTLATGDMIPADAVLIWTKDLFVNQSSLTGESMPVEKFLANEKEVADDLTALDLTNLVFMGTDVLSGQGKAIILKTGQQTFFGDIAKNATTKRGKTTFDLGLAKVSKLLLQMVMVLFPLVFLINGLTKGDWSSAFFFAIAVAVGLTPEMLPMIVSSNLAKGALTLSKHKVIVKELASIQNLGSMDVLCTDKTGTITEDRVVLVQHLDPLGNENDQVLDLAFMNSTYQTGWKNLMDIAVINYFEAQERHLLYQTVQKIDEIPFDFSRRRLTVVMKADEHQLMITKGAVEEMAAVCKYVEINGETLELTSEIRQQLQLVNEKMNRQGMRVITVAVRRDAHDEAIYSTDDEKDMVLIGFMGFLDPAKASAKPAIQSLHQHGVVVKVLTGDNAIVAQKVCQDVGIPAKNYLLGNQIEEMSDEELYQAAETINLFAKLNPMQKSRIIESLQSKGHTVGFMGDGINDAPALRKADVGISVDTAADITKDASSIILLEKSLAVLESGVIEGRRVFSNMMKYIKITISSNFGNVFSILVASAFLPFLPMLSIQLLLQNLIYDIAQLTIPWDNVDEEELRVPTKWETKGLLKFTLCIGPISSIFDIITFLVMWFTFGANTLASQNLFQTGWFMIGLTTQALVVLMVRTKKVPFIQSRPAPQVFASLLLAVAAGILVILTPIADQFDFVHLPNSYWLWYVAIVIGYMIATQLGKMIYIKIAKEWI
ncbi:magnesium-translocating P-type ATPase [Enterococcus dongliensis]|uniref:Magnesium-transporting ATPase, P-type 1 n=1 Tax=Enterococcus dongliensis TaxID=2559925 RepID=A0AAW8TKD0_9ENTE|nr:magnesium-translocating P-type ATPase [Enterococcus dongliensis]MDT2595918.1 magnesium-translocating P-type ATPase [Enterococcus dongliensis]MDT2602821.1 magnesium-translocating P-type ATPase [Enterococcus dongliensis]MDT2633985.1 magnesium-translocating P-type ATPase [Enterococcus dongliensis]MDT2637253.1 magnesium-translocating P-type ATPase [Enterococcus dongliensis]MDT2641909.1 magnesium-translocating P-type ATPase [Enterococcus dongliensis]